MAVLTTAEVADELAIRALAQRFSDAVNRRDAAALAALFAPDGRWDVPGVTETVGPEAIGAAFDALMVHFAFLVQVLHSGVVELDGVRASARWYLTEHARDHEGGGSLFIGYYEDDLAFDGADWHFASRRFRFLYRGRDDLPGRAYPFSAEPASGGRGGAS